MPAAGSGERLGGVEKAFLEVGGRPLLAHALQPFLDHPDVRSVVVALSAEAVLEPPAWLSNLAPRVGIVAGGRTRAHSVLATLEAFDVPPEIVLVHDAARPLVTREIIDRCVLGVEDGAGAVSAWPVVDTLKEVDPDGFVTATPDRDRYRRAQTPQAFPFSSLLDAYRRAVDEELTMTDDAAVFSRFGGRVRVVEGAAWNLKVTHREDVRVAEALLGGTGNQERATGHRPGEA